MQRQLKSGGAQGMAMGLSTYYCTAGAFVPQHTTPHLAHTLGIVVQHAVADAENDGGRRQQLACPIRHHSQRLRLDNGGLQRIAVHAAEVDVAGLAPQRSLNQAVEQRTGNCELTIHTIP